MLKTLCQLQSVLEVKNYYYSGGQPGARLTLQSSPRLALGWWKCALWQGMLAQPQFIVAISRIFWLFTVSCLCFPAGPGTQCECFPNTYFNDQGNDLNKWIQLALGQNPDAFLPFKCINGWTVADSPQLRGSHKWWNSLNGSAVPLERTVSMAILIFPIKLHLHL